MLKNIENRSIAVALGIIAFIIFCIAVRFGWVEGSKYCAR